MQVRCSLGARPQVAELYGRFTLKPSTVFNHQARGNEPSISRVPLEHAGEMQAHLFRTITHRPRRDPRRATTPNLRVFSFKDSSGQ